MPWVLLFAYAGLVTWIVLHSAHPHVAILASQVLLLLPAYFLIGRKESPWNPKILLDSRLYFLLYGVAALTIGWYRGEGLGIASDESAWSFQARIFASGHLTARPLPETSTDPVIACSQTYFEYHLVHNGKWFTQYPFGWPAVLALGLRLKAGWLVNPLLGLLLLWLIVQLARALDPEHAESSPLALLLAVLSPYYVLNCAGFLSHTLCAVFVAGAAICFLAARRGFSVRACAGMFACVAGAVMVRPATGFAAGIVLALALAAGLRRQTKALLWLLGLASGFGVLTVVLIGGYNLQTTGDFFTLQYQLFERKYCYHQIFSSFGSFLRDGLLTLTRWGVQSTTVFSVPFLVVPALYGVWKDRRPEVLALSALAAATCAAALGINTTSASRWGERYYFEAFPIVCVLAARGINLWAPPASRLAAAAALTVAVQIFHFVVLVPPVISGLKPAGAIRRAAEAIPADRLLVYLDRPTLTAKHVNLNDPQWWAARRLYLPDPGAGRRSSVAEAVGHTRYVVVSLSEGSNRISMSPVTTSGTPEPPAGDPWTEPGCQCVIPNREGGPVAQVAPPQ